MSNVQTTAPRRTVHTRTRQLTICAMLCALSIVLARLFGLMPSEMTRFSIEAIPIFLSGMLFGPVAGVLVGFSADFIGCLFSAYGYNPIFCLPPMIYGLCGGLFSAWLKQRASLPRLAVAYLLPVALGSILWQSFALALIYGKGETLFVSWVTFLATRCPQFAVTYILDVFITYLLQKSGVLRAARLQ